jgi:hypothetical protein
MQRLKRGVALFHTHRSGEYFLGTHKRAIRICTPEEKAEVDALLRGVDCVTDTDSYSDAHSESHIEPHQEVDPDVMERTVLSRALSQELIDTRESSVSVSKRFTSAIAGRAEKQSDRSRDAGYIQMQERLAPELSHSTWIEDVDDAGVQILSNRQRYIVELSGNSRVTTLLFPLLIASGVTQVRFTSASRGNFPLVGNTDVGISLLTQKEIGSNFRQTFENLRHELALFPLDKNIDYSDESEPAAISIHCGDIDPELLSLWMSSGQVFLPVAAPIADRVSIGPLVIPGKSPCLRCHQLFIAEQSGVVEVQRLHSRSGEEIPTVAAHNIASIVAAQVIEYLDSLSRVELDNAREVGTHRGTQIKTQIKNLGKAELVGNVCNVDYQSLTHPQIVAIARHPLCGCAFNTF